MTFIKILCCWRNKVPSHSAQNKSKERDSPTILSMKNDLSIDTISLDCTNFEDSKKNDFSPACLPECHPMNQIVYFNNSDCHKHYYDELNNIINERDRSLRLGRNEEVQEPLPSVTEHTNSTHSKSSDDSLGSNTNSWEKSIPGFISNE